MASAGAKWRQFKANLKRQFFDETLTDEQLKNLHGNRIDDDELDSLLKYWRSPESKVRINYYESVFLVTSIGLGVICIFIVYK